MDDEILTITASELDEQISEPDGGTLFVLHDPAGIAPSKKISWTRTVSWILKAGSVVAEMIGMGAVTEDKIGAGAVTETKIGAGAVTSNRIAADGVETGNIKNYNVTEDKIAAGAVTATKIAAGAVINTKIQNGAVSTEKIDDLSVTSDKIASGAVTEDKIGIGAVTEDKIDDGAVTEDKIDDGAVTHDKLGDDAVQSSNVADAAIHVHHLNSEVVNKFGMISLELAAAGVGNASEASPPNYAIDDHYVHTFYLTDQNAVILLENLGDDPVVILSRDVSPSGDGRYRAVVTVRGETGDDIDYKLVVIQFE